jgi:hypothetical protein
LKPGKTKKNMNIYIKLKTNMVKALANFTLAKFCGAIFTITTLAIIKYLISGDFHLEYSDFWNNVGIGLLGWTINTGLIAWLTEYLGIKGINFNLNQFLFGFETMKVGETTKVGETSYKVEDGKPKLYNAMDSGEESTSGKKSGSGKKGLNRNRDVRVHPYPRNGRRAVRSWVFDDESENGSENGSDSGGDNGSGSDTEMEGGPSNRNKNKKLASLTSQGATQELSLDKGNANSVLPTDPLDKGKGIETANASSESPISIWTRVFPGLDPTTIFFPQRTNPGPGFAVPGGEVPIQDEICQHIDYNGHILSQFKNMDLETAVQQRDRYHLCVQIMSGKIAFAQEALGKVPTIPTTEYEFKLRNQISRDLDGLNRVKVRSEARATLLNSRILFIEAQIKNNNNNN